jgi:hypothetical protein
MFASPLESTVALFTDAVALIPTFVEKILPSAEVPATPVTETLPIPTTVTEPIAVVPETPVTLTLAAPTTVEDPMAPVAVTVYATFVFQVPVFHP